MMHGQKNLKESNGLPLLAAQ